jgi:predicted ArsR family transcriptional regulator
MTDRGDSPGFPSQQEARALGHPTRRDLFRFICGAEGTVTIAALTDHVGLHHNAVRQHLAKLVAAGLVEEELEQRTRPGRPRLLYRAGVGAGLDRSEPEVRADQYETLSVWLTQALAGGEGVRAVGRRVGAGEAASPGRGVDPVEALAEQMGRYGFDPSVRRTPRRTEIVLHACPYAAAAATDVDTVCGLHQGIAEGAARALGLELDSLVLRDPARAGCRLVLRDP